MDKKLWAHEKFIKTEIEKFEHKLKNPDNKSEIASIKDDIRKLDEYHQKAIRDFQHERLIHLIVTFFFAGILLLSIVAMLLLMLFPTTYNYLPLGVLIFSIILILFITEVFYVSHYYRLENGTQRLYELSKKLYKLISN